MKKWIFNCVAVCLLLLFGACSKKTFDEYYARPDWLAQPIYQQLDSMGDFKNFLVCIEKAGYKNVLGAGSSWTVFAPTDAAFSKFLSEQGISDVNNIDRTLAEKIVRTAMVYDGERLEKLNDNFSSRGWVPGAAFRRRTVYYDFVEAETSTFDGRTRKIIATNRKPGTDYFAGDNNNKHLSYFFNDYMNLRNLGATDYNTFYPNTTYTGLNIADAKIDPNRNNIIAENGYIHVVDKVLMPQLSIDQYIRQKNDYSSFREVLDLYATYAYNADVTRKYQVLTGNTDSVFVKGYTGLALALNNENYAKEDANDAQVNNFSITAPNNAAVADYARRVLLRFYPAGSTLRDVFYSNPAILTEYVNAHLYNTQLWPSRFNVEQNFQAERPKITSANIKEARLLSNGAFYGVDHSQEADVFRSVFGNVLLDPKYSLMQIALQRMGMNIALKIPSIRYLLMLVSDEELYRMGFAYDAYQTSDPIRFRGAAGSPIMNQLLYHHIVPLGSGSIPDLSGSGMLESYGGEYIRYESNKMYSSGTMDSVVQYATVNSVDVGNPANGGPQNGAAVYVSQALTTSATHVAAYFTGIGAANANSPFNRFYQYLIGSELYSATDGKINGIELGLNYTILVPNNAAIAQAVTDGELPASPTTTDLAQRDKIKRFLQYHIVRNAFAIDGKKTGTFQTICRNIDGDIQAITVVTNQPSQLSVRDNMGNTISADVANSNRLAQRVVVHSMNGYLKNGL